MSEAAGPSESLPIRRLAARGRGYAADRDLRAVALLEGVSYVGLLGVAMPLKYLADMPLAVRIVGTAHGVLFLLYVAAVGRAGVVRRWPARRWAVNLVASLLPLGPFVADRSLRREQHELGDGSGGRSEPAVLSRP